MKRKITFGFLFLALIITTYSCKKKTNKPIAESESKEIRTSKFAQHYPEFNFSTLQDLFKNEVQSDSILSNFYNLGDYKLLWVNDTLDIETLNQFTQLIGDETNHGISPEYFNYSKIIAIRDSIDSGLFANNLDSLYSRMIDLESTSTKSMLKYITGMSYGFTNPKVLFGKDFDVKIYAPDSLYYEQLYSNIHENGITKVLTDVQPKEPMYTVVQDAYRKLKEMTNTDFPKIRDRGTDFVYKLGDQNADITSIAKRLMLTGEFNPNSVLPDSIDYTLDKELLAAINLFRKQNSYPEDQDEIGSFTIQALNRPLSYYEKKIKANMERYRWRYIKPRNDKHIEVNIPSFKLIATSKDFESDSALVMKVCVGRPTNKTPMLESNMGYINLNPEWGVPTSIARKEISVLQKKDQTYLARHNMKLYKGGKEVDPSTIDWKKIDPSKFSYTIRQGSGDSNALGRIKFMFSNDFSVYLHDTPSKRSFGRANRALSHGCIRVQQPLNLAFFCVDPSSDLYKDRIRYSIDLPPVSEDGKSSLKKDELKKLSNIINLTGENKISLRLDYYTIYTIPHDDLLYYADDIYGYDDIILKALSI